MNDKAVSLVWDGYDVAIPESMGAPAPNQMAGSQAECLSELACRICYESMGVNSDGKPRGRSSAKLHEHILEVKHLSVYEHPNYTISIHNGVWLVPYFANRVGIWLDRGAAEDLEVTFNLRSILEWDRHTCKINRGVHGPDLRSALTAIAHELAPQIVTDHGQRSWVYERALLIQDGVLKPEQAWVSLYMAGSRGWSHEQVRHGDWTAISQRSTRYVDEHQSEYMLHPLIHQYIGSGECSIELNNLMADTVELDKTVYIKLVDRLQDYLAKKGTDKATARKQARGAARGLLGNALFTDMIFSASCQQWKWMLQNRCSDAADGEIRLIFNQVLPALQSSRYGKYFADYQTKPAHDGVGFVLA